MKNTRTNYPLKLSGVLLCTTLFMGLNLGMVRADGLDIYGNSTTLVSYSQLNPAPLIPTTDWYTYLEGDIFFQKKDENQFQYLMDLKFNGDRVNSQTETALTVNQLYMLVPFSDKTYLYFGKKTKEIGVCNFFNVCNLISPKYLVNYSYTRDGVDLIELDQIHSDQFSYGLILDSQNIMDGDEVQGVVFTDARFGNFNLEDYLYFQKSIEGSLGLAATYQLGKYQFYTESIWKSKATHRVITGNSGTHAQDFTANKVQNTFAVVLGGSITINNFMAALEYLYNRNGYNAGEQEAFIDYFDKFPSAASQIKNDYNEGAFNQNYLGFKLNQKAFLISELTFGVSDLVSLQPGNHLQDDSSSEISTNLDYTLNQNLDFIFYLTYRHGGNTGEFNRLDSNRELAFVINYCF
jgi:hypothetical protein